MFGVQRHLPSRYDFDNPDDYYDAVEAYYKWLEDKADAEIEEADRALKERED